MLHPGSLILEQVVPSSVALILFQKATFPATLTCLLLTSVITPQQQRRRLLFAI